MHDELPQPAYPTNYPLRPRMNALVRAYLRGEETVKGQPMTREEIRAELRIIKALLEAAEHQRSR